MSSDAPPPGPSQASATVGAFVATPTPDAAPPPLPLVSPGPPSVPLRDLVTLGRDFASSDPSALEEAYQRWCPVVYTAVLKSLGPAAVAEEVTQNVFLEAWRRRDSLDPARRSLSAWLLALARQVVIERRAGSADPTWQRSFDAVVVAHIVAGMDEPRRHILEMSFFEGRTHSFIAETLGLSVSVVRGHIHSGLLQLRIQLEATDEAS